MTNRTVTRFAVLLSATVMAASTLYHSSASAQISPVPLPPQTGHAGQYLGTNGAKATWSSPSGAVIAPQGMLYVAKNGSDSATCILSAPCLTINHTISVAPANYTIVIYPGTYNENVAMVAGKSLQGTEMHSVVIAGNMSASYSGTAYVQYVDLQAASGAVLTVSGANATKLEMYDVHIDQLAGGGHALSYTASNAASKFTLSDGLINAADTSAGSRAINAAAGSAGSIILQNVSINALDNFDHVAMALAGGVSVTHSMDTVNGQITVANTASLTESLVRHTTTTVAILNTTSSGATVFLDCIDVGTASPIITGSGIFYYSGIILGSTGAGSASTLNGGLGSISLQMAPIKIRAGTLKPVPQDGLIEYDGTHFYFDIGVARYQIDQQSGGSGTVTTVSVVGANGFTGTVANPTTTPAITLSTSITGVLKGNGTAISTAANSDLPAMSATIGGAAPTPPNDSTQYLNGTGSWSVPPGSSTGGSTLGTPQATTSGTSFDFTGIPAGVKRITLSLRGVAMGSATQYYRIQIGPVGGVETSGYCFSFWSPNTAYSSGGGCGATGYNFIYPVGIGSVIDGAVVLTLENSSTNQWVFSSVASDPSAGINPNYGAGSKSISGALSVLRLTTAGGTAVFNAGSINILYDR